MVSRVPFSVALLLTIAVQASMARAEPVLITSGTAVLNNTPTPLTMLVHAEDLTLSLSWMGGDPQSVPFVCSAGRCFEGSPLNLSTTVITTSPINVPPAENELFGSVGGGYLAFSGSLNFVAPTVTLPPTGGDIEARALFAEPFTLSGTLTAYRVLNLQDPIELFTLTLRGSGTVNVALPANGRGGYDWGTMTYEFQPVPEPASLLLIGGGVAAAALRTRRRRESSRPSGIA